MNKNISFFLLVMLLTACNSTKVDQTVSLNETQKVDWNRSIVETKSAPSTVAIDNTKKTSGKGKAFTDAGTIKSIMDFLASDDLQGRDTGSEGIAKAAQLIENSFKTNGVSPYFSSYKDTLSNLETTAYNVVGYLEGRDPKLKDKFVVIGAHYDHIGIVDGSNGDVIANGANDNASGTTTVMELARYFGSKKNNKRSILFALFSAEEQGLLGSKHLAERLKEQDLDLYVMLNFEMVGVPMVDKEYLLYMTGYELSNLADISNGYANIKFAGFLPKAKEFNLFKRSDNYPFHNIFNVPSQTYSTFDFTNFEYYHKVGDETKEMDFEHMARVVNEAVPVMEGIINAPTGEIRYN